MKNTLLYPLLFCAATLFAACSGSDDDPTQTGEFITIPDPAFEAYCLENFDRNGDGKIREGEAAVVTKIRAIELGIQSLEGIEHFTALEELECYTNNLTSLDVSKNTTLTKLHCSNNQLTSLYLSNNTALKRLFCDSNSIDTLDLSKNIELWDLTCYRNNLTSLDLSKNTLLERLEFQGNKIAYIDISTCPKLHTLDCNNNNLIQLDVSNNKKLSILLCQGNPMISIFIWPGCTPSSFTWSVPTGVQYIEKS